MKDEFERIKEDSKSQTEEGYETVYLHKTQLAFMLGAVLQLRRLAALHMDYFETMGKRYGDEDINRKHAECKRLQTNAIKKGYLKGG